MTDATTDSRANADAQHQALAQPAGSLKLFRVRVEFETVILAASATEAEDAAEWVIKNEDDPAEITSAAEIASAAELPSGWNAQCRPWGERDPEDRTIEEILSANP